MSPARLAPRDYPVAAASCTARARASCDAEKRVGKHVAIGRTEAAFERFLGIVEEATLESLSSPRRFLPLPGLVATIAYRIPGLTAASEVLIEGFAMELVARGRVPRIMVISRQLKPYQVFYDPQLADSLRRSVATIREALSHRGVLQLVDASDLLAPDLVEVNRAGEVIFEHLLYLGAVTTDIDIGQPLSVIRSPFR